MIENLEETQNKTPQNMEQTQVPKMGATIINNETAAFEQIAAKATVWKKFFLHFLVFHTFWKQWQL